MNVRFGTFSTFRLAFKGGFVCILPSSDNDTVIILSSSQFAKQWQYYFCHFKSFCLFVLRYLRINLCTLIILFSISSLGQYHTKWYLKIILNKKHTKKQKLNNKSLISNLPDFTQALFWKTINHTRPTFHVTKPLFFKLIFRSLRIKCVFL